MNENEFDLTARAWLEDGPTRMSDRAVLAALEEIHTTRQRRARGPAWKAIPARTFARVGMAAVLVVAVGFLAVTFVPRPQDASSVGGPATSSPPASPSPPGETIELPNLTKSFVSPRNGFSMKHPEGYLITPADNLWDPSNHLTDRGVDVVETAYYGVLKGASAAGVRLDDAFSAPSCGGSRSQQAEITIDGRSGRIAECPGEIVATVLVGDRLYRFTMLHELGNARAVFDTIAATIDLTPETAIAYPKLGATFVSPTNGFSFDYVDRGGLAPAAELWDPANQQPDIDPDAGFDAVETGYGAYFKAASTEIPDEVSIDAWVDEHVTHFAAYGGGCSIPRSRQSEITIDGLSGRVAECQSEVHGIQATVAAGGRLYLFVLLADRTDARAFFDVWVETIDLRPEDAAVGSTGSP